MNYIRVLVLLFLIGCSDKRSDYFNYWLEKSYTSVNIELIDKSIFINKKKCNLKDVSMYALEAIHNLENKGVSRKEIIFIFKVDSNVKMGLVMDVKSKIKKLNIKNIEYKE